MEVEQPQLDVIKSALKLDTDSQDNELNEDENFNFDKTVEVENSSLKAVLSELVEVNSTNETVSENGKRKAKEEKPPSKIVVRRLPPSMTKDQFLEQVSPLPDVDYMYYVQGNMIDSINPFSRAYLNFVNQDDLFSFSNTFDNYVFLDSKGQEYPAVVEFNMVQRFPKQRNKKKDPLAGTIESDPAWITFKENLLAEALENSKTQSGKATKQHFFETEISTTEEVNTTPLLEFLKVRRAEKARIREERREEKKRKEIERKLKQKTKDKKEGEEEEAPKDVKIHHKQSEKQDKEYNKIIKKCGEDKVEREEKTESIKQIINPTKKILILKAGSEGVDKIQKKSDISNSEQNMIVESGKCDIISSSTNLIKQVDTNKVKEAEQQTMFLRKLLGLLPTDDKNTSNDNEVSAKSNDQLKTSSDDSCRNSKVRERLSVKEPPEEVLSAFQGYLSVNQKKELYWSKENINPGLPSASFRASGGGGKGESGESEPGSFEKQDKPRLLSSPQLSQPNREEVLTSKDRRDQKERERGIKKKDEKEKVKEPRVREFKSRGGKSYQEERLKLAERREEKKREMQNSGDKKQDQVDSSDMTESTINESKSNEEKIIKIDKKRFERKGRYDNEEWKEEKKRMRNEKNAGKRDGRDRREDYSRRHSDRKSSDLDLRRKGKNYKNSDSNKADKRKGRDQDSQESNISSQQDKPQEQAVKRRSRSFDDLNLIPDGNGSQGVTSKDDSPNKKRSNSLENQRSDKSIMDVEKIIIQKKEKNHSRDYLKQTENSSSSRSRKDRSKTESKVAFSKTKERVGEKDDKDDTNKSKNLDGSGDIDSKGSNKAPARSDRRIRNKDRPSIEIYRPGMGKFSKQRLEKEKALGSSTEVDSPSHSPSPTPKSKLIS